MILTKECDYAMRILRQLSDMEIHATSAVCDKESVPEKFAYKILKRLEHALLVKSYRGKDGGYALLRDPGEISLYDVILAIDGPLVLNNCLKNGVSCPNDSNEKHCFFHEEFQRMQEALIQSFSEKTVGQVLKI